MSETYFVGGDTLVKCDNPDWQAQTFRVHEPHILHFLDLECRGVMTFWGPVIQVFMADASHRPFGECLSRDRYIVEGLPNVFVTGRVCWSMQPYLLLPGYYYCLTVAHFPTLGQPSFRWQYNKDNGTYPYGHRISSSDSGATWTDHFFDDFMFGEFGVPPLATPEPPPPIHNAAVINLTYTHWDVGLSICLHTNVPCNLTLYYTNEPPRKHHTTRIVRGLTVPWATYFCFVAWTPIPQNEAGDTLYHTFDLPTWLENERRWFSFRSEVDFQDIPSVGPIFDHTHPGGLPRTLVLLPDASGNYCSIQSQVSHPCPNHYLEVKEEPPDGDLSKVFMSLGTAWEHDTYNIPNIPPDITKITNVQVRCLVRRSGGMYYVRIAGCMIFTNGWILTGPTYALPESWTWIAWDFPLNPITSEPWTVSEVNSMQPGVRLRAYQGVGWSSYGHCTNVRIHITRGIEGCPF